MGAGNALFQAHCAIDNVYNELDSYGGTLRAFNPETGEIAIECEDGSEMNESVKPILDWIESLKRLPKEWVDD